MDRVTTSLERSLALLMGTQSLDGQLILPSEVILGSNRLHPKSATARSKSSHSHMSSVLTADSSLQTLELASISSSRLHHQRRWASEESDDELAIADDHEFYNKHVPVAHVVMGPPRASSR